MNDLRITKGNVFSTILEIKAYRYDNTEIEDFDLRNCTDIRIKYRVDGVIREITNYKILPPKELQLEWGSKSKSGSYTIEITGRYDRQNWRYYSKNTIFKIVETTQDLNIPEDAVLKDGTYYILGTKIYILASKATEIKIDKATGHWIIGGEDTGFSAKGEKGDKGDSGDPGIGDYNQLRNLPDFARIAFTGDYDDLYNRPIVPEVPSRISQLINDAGFITNSNIVKNYYNKTQVDDIAAGILQTLAVIKVEDIDQLIECGLYRIDDNVEERYGSGPRLTYKNTITPRLIAVVERLEIRGNSNARKRDVFQYDLQNRTVRQTTLSLDLTNNAVSEWSDWVPMDNFAVTMLSGDYDEILEDLVEPGIYRTDYTEDMGQFDEKVPSLVIVSNQFDDDTRTTHQLRIVPAGIYLDERVDEVELDDNGNINVLSEGEWIRGHELYQRRLVSGENIKSINNVSLVGSGNITVSELGVFSQDQADWNQTDSTAVDYIKNKPDLDLYATYLYVDNITDDMQDWHKLRNVYLHGEISHDPWDDISVCYLAVNHFYWYEDCIQATFVLPWPSDDADNPYNDKTFDIYLWVTFDATAGDDAYIKFLASPDYGNSSITYDTTSEKLNFDPSYYNLMHIYWMNTHWFIHNTVVLYLSGYQEVHFGENHGCIQLSKLNNIGRPGLATVAFTGLYNDLQGKPNIPEEVQLAISNLGFVTQSDLEGKANTSDLARVAFTGKYTDLTNTPLVVSAFTNDAGYITSANLDAYYTKAYIDETLDNYYTKTQIDAALAASGNFDPNSYYTRNVVDGKIATLNQQFSNYYNKTTINTKLNSKADKTALNDKVDKSSLTNAKLNTNISTRQDPVSNEDILGGIKLHKVSKTGDYNDLSVKLTASDIAAMGFVKSDQITSSGGGNRIYNEGSDTIYLSIYDGSHYGDHNCYPLLVPGYNLLKYTEYSSYWNKTGDELNYVIFVDIESLEHESQRKEDLNDMYKIIFNADAPSEIPNQTFNIYVVWKSDFRPSYDNSDGNTPSSNEYCKKITFSFGSNTNTNDYYEYSVFLDFIKHFVVNSSRTGWMRGAHISEGQVVVIPNT